MDDFYFTIKIESRTETKIKNSKFIGQTYSVDSIESAQSILTEIKKKEYNANHNCFAFIIGLGNKKIFKYSDDGEPNGTAGKPIYDVMDGNQLTNILLVVTRYFGGTKLGTGGLVKAYGEAAKSVLEKSGIVKKYITDVIEFDIDFLHFNSLNHIIANSNARILKSDFSNHVKIKLEVRKSKTTQIKNELTELTSGKVSFIES
jgi:uncharacterized YigZ family protein